MSGGDLEFPAFEGHLLLDEPSLAAASRDFGGHVSRRPRAVLAPASVADVQAMVRFAAAHRLPVAARGQGHSTFGQSQAEGGVVLDLRSLGRVRDLVHDLVHDREDASVLVDGGATWGAVLAHTVPRGLTPPTLTDYQELSVGGTLSVGGIGGESHRHGAQVDNVIALDVVTGEGDLVHCSATEEPALFDACRAGLGQHGVLVGARLRLVAAPAEVHVRQVKYDALAPFLADLRRLAAELRCDHLYGNITALEGGGWEYELCATHHGDLPARPLFDDDRAGLTGAASEQTMPFLAFARRVDGYAAAMKQVGLWDLPHPWLDLFVPASAAEGFLAGELARLSPDRLGQGGVLVYPLRRSRCHAPSLALPAEEELFLFDVFRNAVPADAAHVAALLDENRRAYLACRALGGTLYPIGSMPMEQGDWARHFHPRWEHLQAVKRRHDPAGILGPGPALFG